MESSTLNGTKMVDFTRVEDQKRDEKDGEAGQGDIPARETWGSKVEFLLSVIGFAVDLGNVWRFPYICYKNGGGAFLIPYLIMLIFGGLPLFYMELALGQFHRSGCISIWERICPMFKGIGFGICIISCYVAMYYNTVIAWAVYFLVASLRGEVPWARCRDPWQTPDCVDFFTLATANSSTVLPNTSRSAALEYFEYGVLESQYASGLGHLGGVKWSLALCLIAVFIVVYFSMWKGIKSSGKVVWVTATLPYVVLLILLVRGATLPGSLDGIRYYLTPTWGRLKDPLVWVDAATQVFFSLGPGFGVLMALSSYNKFHNNCYVDAMVTASINCATSFLAGFVVFSVLGYMALVQRTDIANVASPGAGLVFVVYPEAIATLSGSVFWAIIFFLMLITLGLDSTFGGLEALLTGLSDEWPILRRKRELFVAGFIAFCFLGSLPTVTYGGSYVVNLLDNHGAPFSILVICLVEVIAVNWFYGVRRFADDIKEMLGFRPGYFWLVCWAVISPAFLIALCIASVVCYVPLSVGDYTYPPWATAVGWLVTLSSAICIPVYMGYRALTYGFRGLVTPGDKEAVRGQDGIPLSPAYL